LGQNCSTFLKNIKNYFKKRANAAKNRICALNFLLIAANAECIAVADMLQMTLSV